MCTFNQVCELIEHAHWALNEDEGSFEKTELFLLPISVFELIKLNSLSCCVIYTIT